MNTIQTDDKLIEAYKNHSNRIIIGSCENFNQKVKNVIAEIEKINKEN